MLKRELIVTEIWKRLAGISGVTAVRNPEYPPQAEDMPWIGFFELPDEVTDEKTDRDGLPVYAREFQIIVEMFVSGANAEASSRALISLLSTVRLALFATPRHLNQLGKLQEQRTGRIVTVDAANHIKATAILYAIKYTEAIANDIE